MCCLALTAGFIGPRVALILWWLFDADRFDAAFGSWAWPILGIAFLPWTTLAYLVVWSPIVGVDDWEWLIVALGFLLDLATYSSRAAASRYRSSGAY